MNPDRHYNTTIKVQNGIGVLARLTIALRKFNVNIQSIDVLPLDNEKNFYDIHIVVDTAKDPEHMEIVMKKLERLIHVISVKFEEIQD